ncbi:MAG TPA: hypothetical protein VGB46_06675 [Flavisolibacter sp.]|jgi:hypothetical protein
MCCCGVWRKIVYQRNLRFGCFLQQAACGARLLPLLSVSSARNADIVLVNGKIFTSDTDRLYVDGLAIKGNRTGYRHIGPINPS